ncbi:LOW QUALITY PROTEIN: chaperone protein DnaJ 2-like [Anopheles moucheti]|uniref:LOW QUALITY PROTEIN: chaperone protein DnaJ 2-like n=1 Tax=Anopheles moucheti TaxID=186751 RepID=UPI0022F028B6|nr:LOW QUALITY PROTEIN: chaperone protein DnaJ 2-like [Anopheles moucheti]
MNTPNYYAALAVREDAPMREICQAYQQYAPLCHPESKDYDPEAFPIKNLEQREYWLLINEACEVLTNAEWRARYNVGTLKEHFPVYEFSGNCFEIFQHFAINPRSYALMPPDENNNETAAPHELDIASLLTVPSLVFHLELEIEECFHGTTKEITFPRSFTVEGRYRTVWQTMAIPISPYMRHGGLFQMKGFGHRIDEMWSDVSVILVVKPHHTFTVVGDDLMVNVTVPLSAALFGGILHVRSIDQKLLTTDIIPPFPTALPMVKQFQGEGMKTPTGRGNLFVNIYPTIPRVPHHLLYDATRIIHAIDAQHLPHTVARVKLINGTVRALSRVITLLLLPPRTAQF